ncbi:MAG TPA: nitroreductase family protein [Candidatus Acidoferrales bacterium]|nr:nitroreductase family protein [Candidatus Acidoferrales bacterium]
MKNPAPAQFPIDPLLANRWSPRAFADRPVEPAKLRQLFEAARWAASCYNDQPWNYIVATREDPAGFGKMLACLMEGNQAWAKSAPVLAISVARTKFKHDGSVNRHAQHDVGAASACLALEAESLDLAVHQMGGFDANRARHTYHIPADHDPMAAIAIGYPGDPAALPDKLRERELAPRSRRPISDFVYSGDWGSVAPFISDAK